MSIRSNKDIFTIDANGRPIGDLASLARFVKAIQSSKIECLAPTAITAPIHPTGSRTLIQLGRW